MLPDLLRIKKDLSIKFRIIIIQDKKEAINVNLFSFIESIKDAS